jgi:hypothetical protein
MRTGRHDQVLELQFRLPAGTGNLQGPWSGQRRAPLDELHLPQLRDAADAGGQLVDNALLEGAQRVEVDRRLAEGDPPLAGVPRLVHHLGDVEQRLGRDAAAVEADTSRVLLLVDEGDLHPEIRRIKRRRIAAWSGAEDRYLNRVCH